MRVGFSRVDQLSYTLRTGAGVKANLSASKAACHSAPNYNDFCHVRNQ